MEDINSIAEAATMALKKIADTKQNDLSAAGVAAQEGLKTALENQLKIVAFLKGMKSLDGGSF